MTTTVAKKKTAQTKKQVSAAAKEKGVKVSKKAKEAIVEEVNEKNPAVKGREFDGEY